MAGERQDRNGPEAGQATPDETIQADAFPVGTTGTPEGLVQVHRRTATRLLREGAAQQAFAELVRASRDVPMDGSLAGAMTFVAIRAGTEPAAITLLSSGLDDAEGSSRIGVRRQLSRLFRRARAWERAREQMVMVLAEKPGDRRARRTLNELLWREERWEELDASLEKETREALKGRRLRSAARATLHRARVWSERLDNSAHAAIRFGQAAQYLEEAQEHAGAFRARKQWLRSLAEARAPKTVLDEAVKATIEAGERLKDGRAARVFARDLGLISSEEVEAAETAPARTQPETLELKPPRGGAGGRETVEFRIPQPVASDSAPTKAGAPRAASGTPVGTRTTAEVGVGEAAKSGAGTSNAASGSSAPTATGVIEPSNSGSSPAIAAGSDASSAAAGPAAPVAPFDRAAFARLEAQHVAKGAWRELASLYTERAAATGDSAERAEMLARKAEILEDELGDLAGAARTYGELARASGDKRALDEQVRLLEKLDTVSGVKRALDDAVDLATDDASRANGLVTRGEAALIREEFATARKDFEAALALESASLPARAGLAEAAAAQGELGPVRALKELLVALPRRERARTELFRRLARVVERYAPSDLELARLAWSEVLADVSVDPEAQDRLAGIARKLDDTGSLEQVLRAKIRRDPRALDGKSLRLELVTLLERGGRDTEAMDELMAAVRFDPGHREAWLRLADRYIEQPDHGRAAWALEHAATATEDESDRAALWERLAAHCTTRLQDPERAKIYASRAAGLRAQSPSAKVDPRLLGNSGGMTSSPLLAPLPRAVANTRPLSWENSDPGFVPTQLVVPKAGSETSRSETRIGPMPQRSSGEKRKPDTAVPAVTQFKAQTPEEASAYELLKSVVEGTPAPAPTVVTPPAPSEPRAERALPKVPGASGVQKALESARVLPPPRPIGAEATEPARAIPTRTARATTTDELPAVKPSAGSAPQTPAAAGDRKETPAKATEVAERAAAPVAAPAEAGTPVSPKTEAATAASPKTETEAATAASPKTETEAATAASPKTESAAATAGSPETESAAATAASSKTEPAPAAAVSPETELAGATAVSPKPELPKVASTVPSSAPPTAQTSAQPFAVPPSLKPRLPQAAQKAHGRATTAELPAAPAPVERASTKPARSAEPHASSDTDAKVEQQTSPARVEPIPAVDLPSSPAILDPLLSSIGASPQSVPAASGSESRRSAASTAEEATVGSFEAAPAPAPASDSHAHSTVDRLAALASVEVGSSTEAIAEALNQQELSPSGLVPRATEPQTPDAAQPSSPEAAWFSDPFPSAPAVVEPSHAQADGVFGSALAEAESTLSTPDGGSPNPSAPEENAAEARRAPPARSTEADDADRARRLMAEPIPEADAERDAHRPANPSAITAATLQLTPPRPAAQLPVMRASDLIARHTPRVSEPSAGTDSTSAPFEYEDLPTPPGPPTTAEVPVVIPPEARKDTREARIVIPPAARRSTPPDSPSTETDFPFAVVGPLLSSSVPPEEPPTTPSFPIAPPTDLSAAATMAIPASEVAAALEAASRRRSLRPAGDFASADVSERVTPAAGIPSATARDEEGPPPSQPAAGDLILERLSGAIERYEASGSASTRGPRTEEFELPQPIQREAPAATQDEERAELFAQVRDNPLDADAYHLLADHFDRLGDVERGDLMAEIATALESVPEAPARVPRLILSARDRAGLRHPLLRTEAGELLSLCGVGLCKLFPSSGRAAGSREAFHLESGPGAQAAADAVLAGVRILGMRAPDLYLAEDSGPPFALAYPKTLRLLVGRAAVRKAMPAPELRFFAGRALFTQSPDLLALRSLSVEELAFALETLGIALFGGKRVSEEAWVVREAISPKVVPRLRELFERARGNLDLDSLAEGARHSANRAGLVVAGAVSPALSALRAKKALDDEIAELVRFAASERYLHLRSRRIPG